jgi:drug/metabolite transporter (DMT)-like permease
VAATPTIFVILWSTGFIGAKLGLPYCEPLTFLTLRMAVVVTLLATLALIGRASWPRGVTAGHNAVAGLLVHGGYLGGVFSAIHQGLPAGLTALIVGLQPLLTAIAAGLWLRERITPRQWLGFVLGLAGVALVVWDKVSLTALRPAELGLAVVALVSITVGTLYQKRYCGGVDFRTGGVIQYTAAGLALFALAAATETGQIQWTGEFVFALAWLSLVLSVGAISLFYALIRRGAAARVSSLFYLTPPVTALMAYGLFGETLAPRAVAGMGVAALAVAMIVRNR